MLPSLLGIAALNAALHAPIKTRGPMGVTTYQGSFADGATYLMQVPSNWNGTLVLYSHGYVAPGQSNPALDAGDSTTGNYLLANGFALGGSSYASTGWAVQQALPDQIEVLDTFAGLVGTPQRTIAWGHSLGGLVTAGLIQQYPARFNGAMPMCGVVGGGVGLWNAGLDAAFAFNLLLAGSTLQVVNITNPSTNYENAQAVLSDAQDSAQGQARLALVAALDDTPGWYNPAYPPPPPTDYADQESNQFLWFQQVDFIFDFYLRAELEARAGGNPSFNTGVDYRHQLARSVNLAEVQALYTEAGLNLDADLGALDRAPRIAALPAALTYLSDNIIFDGQIAVPVLTMHTEGDGLVDNQNERAYGRVVSEAGNEKSLRETFVYRAGHCEFTPGETIAAFQALVRRLDTGRWSGLGVNALNAVATGLGSSYNPAPASFAQYEPAQFLRPYDGVPPLKQRR